MKPVVGAYTIGWSANNPATRNIYDALAKNGWQKWVDTEIKPAIDAGFTRFFLHNPGGCLAGEDMQPDQFIYAENAGLTFITKEFVSAWRPITAQGIEVISYQGYLPKDPDFLKLAKGRLTKDDWLRRIERSYHHALDAGMSIGFDSSGNVQLNTPEYHFMSLLKALGVKVYLEPWIHKTAPHLFSWDNLTASNFMRHVDSTWAADRSQLTGEVMNFLQHLPYPDATWQNVPEWIGKWVKEQRDLGNTPMIPASAIVKAGKTLQEVLSEKVTVTKIETKPVLSVESKLTGEEL